MIAESLRVDLKFILGLLVTEKTGIIMEELEDLPRFEINLGVSLK